MLVALRSWLFVGTMPLTFQDFAREIQPGKFRIRRFDQFENPQRLSVMVETAIVLQAFIEYVFAGMPKRRMPHVMSEGKRFDEIFIEPERASNGAGNR
jgi:hypothetical protein